VKLLNYFVKIIYRSHLEITSIVGTVAFPKATTPLLPVGEALKPLALFTELPRRAFSETQGHKKSRGC
jgi:hypothetical protein